MKDIYISAKTKISENMVPTQIITEYKATKTNFMWHLKEFAEQVMPFKMFSFFYNLDAGVIGHKFILHTILQHCIYKSIYSKTQEIEYLTLSDAIARGYQLLSESKELSPEIEESKMMEAIDLNTANKVINLLTHGSQPYDIKAQHVITLMQKCGKDIQMHMTDIVYTSLAHIDFVFNKHNLKLTDIDLSLIENKIKSHIDEQNINLMYEYYMYIHHAVDIEDMLSLVAKCIPEISVNGLVYYERKIDVVLKCLNEEVKHDRTVLLFFELKSHIHLFNHYVKQNAPDLKLEVLDAQDKHRDEIITRFNNRLINGLSTTYSLTARGFNFNNTDTIIFFMPTSKYDLYNQAKYRNNRHDNKLSTIYHIDFIYDKHSINNKIYKLYIKKEVTKNIMENLISISMKQLTDILSSLSPNPKKRFGEIYKHMSKNINSNEIDEKEFIDGLKEIYNLDKFE